MQENPDLDALPEEVRGLVLDREQMMAALQASKEQHLAFIDVAEDGIAMRETRQTPDLVCHRKLFAVVSPLLQPTLEMHHGFKKAAGV